MLLLLLAVATLSFGAGLLALSEQSDLLATLLCVVGALALRTLSLAARVAQKGAR
jgi:hypothetical protein